MHNSKLWLNIAAFRVELEAGIMGRVVLWDTACHFSAIILNQSIFIHFITSASTLHYTYTYILLNL